MSEKSHRIKDTERQKLKLHKKTLWKVSNLEIGMSYHVYRLKIRTLNAECYSQ